VIFSSPHSCTPLPAGEAFVPSGFLGRFSFAHGCYQDIVDRLQADLQFAVAENEPVVGQAVEERIDGIIIPMHALFVQDSK
jgi:hypothetical protein